MLSVALTAVLIAAGTTLWTGHAQTLPEGANAVPFECPPPDDPPPPPASEEERRERERRAAYRTVFPAYLAIVPPEPDSELVMPVDGVRVSQVADTWGAARSEGRRHEGQDIFAARNTPIRSATPGWVYRIGDSRLGGRTVVVIGGGGRRYYYAHLEAYNPDLREGQRVDVGDLLGFVGNSGNAITTPPHLHFGVYESQEDVCSWDAINPYGLLVDRD